MSPGIADLKQSAALILSTGLAPYGAPGPLAKLDRAVFRGRPLFFASEPRVERVPAPTRFVRGLNDH